MLNPHKAGRKEKLSFVSLNFLQSSLELCEEEKTWGHSDKKVIKMPKINALRWNLFSKHSCYVFLVQQEVNVKLLVPISASIPDI